MKCKGSGGKKRNYMYYTCEKCHINFNEAHVEQLLENFIYDLLEYDMAVKKFFLPILEDKNSNINTKKLDKEIQELENQRARIKDAYIKGIIKLNEYSEQVRFMATNKIETKEDLENFVKNNYKELSTLKGRRENLWKKYHRAKTEEQKSEILTEINNIKPTIRGLRKYDKYCKDIKDRPESIQNNLNNFDKDMQKEKDNSRSL